MTVGTKIKKLRELRNITQDFLAEQLGVSQNAYSKIERDETDVSFSRLTQIAKVLDLDVLDVIGFDEKKLFFTITHNTDSNNGLIIQSQGLLDKEKSLYEQVIAQLREENSYLKKILDSYVK